MLLRDICSKFHERVGCLHRPRRSNGAGNVRSGKANGEAMSDGASRQGGQAHPGSVLRIPCDGLLGTVRTAQAGLGGRLQVTSQRGVQPDDPGQRVADRVGHVLPGLLVTSPEFPGSAAQAIGRRELATDESEDRMKRLASRSTWWHTLPHKGYTRSTPQSGEVSHGPYWHRRAQEGKSNLYLGRGGRTDRAAHPHRARPLRGGAWRPAPGADPDR